VLEQSLREDVAGLMKMAAAAEIGVLKRSIFR
jgi:hypothetical protein